MKLAQVLFSQGFGARRECEGLIAAGLVRIGGEVVDDPAADVPTDGLQFEVEGKLWTYHEKALVLLHKPAGYECSQKPSAWPSVLSLLPGPLRRRGVQPIGRLDQDTTGALLLTDDGTLIHKLTSPKHHVPKVYEATTAEPVTPAQVTALLKGVVLHDDPLPVRAAGAQALGDRHLQLILTEGKYHQVKRMVAAAGNHVDQLHRSAFGALALPADLAPGQWRWIADPGVIFGTR
jgi:16S rRNA pseudouridine516 synthase